MDLIRMLEEEQMRDDIPEFAPGDTVEISIRVSEGGRERVQRFRGTVMRRQNGGINETFTVRRFSYGVGIERTFPLHSPRIDEINVIRRGDVNRAKLYYLRKRKGKSARIREKRTQRTQ